MAGRKAILIVDDELDICTLLEYNLQKEGFVTHSVHDGISALK
ncbi:MAG TPA: response regulator transcription factor, partial [Nitrospirae bacterium]|nr:response regulator transcription factor [Nitrospirota bacterium]